MGSNIQRIVSIRAICEGCGSKIRIQRRNNLGAIKGIGLVIEVPGLSTAKNAAGCVILYSRRIQDNLLLTIPSKTAIVLFVKSKGRWFNRFWQEITSIFRWMIPGIGVKRWLLLILLGITLLGVGLAFLLLDIYRNAPETWWLPLLSYASLRFLDRTLRVVIFGSLGVGLIVYGIWGLNHSLLSPFRTPGIRLVDQISDYRRRKRGRRIVVIGGGHGLATLLRGLKEHTRNLTAIVTVADDGGSSGELRRTLGILPPGDIRNCLAALSDDEAMLTQLFQYRFSSESGLGGHSFGNLFITALSEVTGSFEEAVAESAKVLGVNGEVLPATLHDVRLLAMSNYRTREARFGWQESTIPKCPDASAGCGWSPIIRRHSRRSSNPFFKPT
jgi:hypothetical protein